MITLKNSIITIEIIEDCGFTVSQIYYKNHPILYFPYEVSEYKKNWDIAGIPFLYPYANRLSKSEFLLLDKKISIPKESKFDANHLPIHGLLLKTDLWKIHWETFYLDSQSISAEIDFSKIELYKIFPFEHSINYKIEIKENQVHFYITIDPKEKLPISFGFHPYFNLYGDKQSIKLKLPAKKHINTDSYLIPLGENSPIESYFENIKKELRQDDEGYIFTIDHSFDDGFTEFYEKNNYNKIQLLQNTYVLDIYMDKHFEVCQIYSPIDKNFICIEPMITTTNAFIRGNYKIITEKTIFHYFLEIKENL